MRLTVNEDAQIGSQARASYVLGHGPREIERLIAQAQHYRDQSEQLLRLAGLREGMRVLDIGCGPGDLAMLASDLVGRRGAVVGIDRSPIAIGVARARARSEGRANLQFEVQDVVRFSSGSTLNGARTLFDAIIGRLVLMYLPEPAAVLRQLLPYLMPSGIVTFQEIHVETAAARPSGELFERCVHWVEAAYRHARADLTMGFRLPEIFVSAGLPVPHTRLDALVEVGPDARGYSIVAEVVRTLLPVIEAAGIGTADEIDVDTLEQRLRDEAARCGSTLINSALAAAWARRV